MDRRHALDTLSRLQSALHARGIARAGVFGSVARDNAGPDSDIDIVLTPAPNSKLTLFDLGAVQDLLEHSFPLCAVDLVIEPIRDRALLAVIEQERLYAF